MFTVERLEANKDERKLIEIRKLWKLVFPEDSNNFLDYYFQWVIPNNTIFQVVVADSEQLVGMLHLNPYEVIIGGVKESIYYVVAVATHPEFRRQGIMKTLLQEAEIYARQINAYALILQPEDERYYSPFGYQFINQQFNTTINTKKYIRDQIAIEESSFFSRINDSEFRQLFSQYLAEIEVGGVKEFVLDSELKVVQNMEYGIRLFEEVTSENGIVLFHDQIFVFCYINDEQMELRKIIMPKNCEVNKEIITKSLIEYAYPRKLIFHETNERTLTQYIPYHRTNLYDVRQYMMILLIQEKRFNNCFFDEVV